MTNLTKIANKYNTDKGTVAYEKHGYTEEYSKYIPENGEYALLEIGYWHGDSARMWEDYNSDLDIIVLDIDNNCKNFTKEEDKYSLFIGDASKESFLKKIFEEYSDAFDFIIDDGSHRYEDILASFKLLYPKLKPGGYYFIEDLHAGHSGGVWKVIEGCMVFLDRTMEYQIRCNDKLLIIKKL